MSPGTARLFADQLARSIVQTDVCIGCQYFTKGNTNRFIGRVRRYVECEILTQVVRTRCLRLDNESTRSQAAFSIGYGKTEIIGAGIKTVIEVANRAVVEFRLGKLVAGFHSARKVFL